MATRIISLAGGGPWGFTISGGRDFGSPLCISKVTAGGKASRGGVSSGAFVVEINGDQTEGLLHFDAQQMIKATGMSLQLKLSTTPPKSPSQSRANQQQATPTNTTDSRPRPPSPPRTIPASGGGAKSPGYSSPSSSSPAPPREDSVKLPYPDGPPVQRTAFSPETAGLGGGGGRYQSPSFQRLQTSPETVPSALGRPPRPPSPPSEKMRDIHIDVKTYKPPPPPTVTSKVTSPPKMPPVPKPAPPPSSSPSPKPPSMPTSPAAPAGHQQMSPAVAAKLSERQGMCAACTHPIRGPYATAMGRCWHPEHFVCTSCQKQLQNTMFVFEEESIFCEKCYEKKFAKTCHSCHRPIIGPCITAQNMSWHQEHFVCSRCNADLSQAEGFNMEAGRLFCADCYGESYGATCGGCGNKIGGGQLWVEALDQQWHSQCFICTICKNPLEGGSFFSKLGRPYCKNCV